MRSPIGYVVVALVGIIIGYFAGREHLKYEMKSAFESAAEDIQKSFSSSFGEDTDSDKNYESNEKEYQHEQNKENKLETAYIRKHLKLYDISASYKESLLEGKVPGVLFKIKNNGDRVLDKVEVTIYFKDANGNIIAEENYLPVLVSEYSFSGDNNPLKPGYIWQMEKGKFYAAKQVPSEWKVGSVDAAITEIRFAE